MKTLIIVTHSDMGHSIINKHWIEELGKYLEEYTIS